MSYIINSFLWITNNILWINILLAIVLVFFERRNPTTTWLWLMVLTFLPGIGFILYLFLGQDLSKKRMFNTKKAEDYCFKELVKSQKKEIKNEIYEYKDPNYLNYEDLIKMHLISSDAFFSQDNNVEIYFEGNEKFKAMIESINMAKVYIHMEYYIFKSDKLGKAVIDALCKKAEEGVEVKVLYDGMGGRKLSRKAINRLKEFGAEVAVFFPPFVPLISLRINYRNHRKICIVDGKESYIGGLNIGDEYIGRSKKFG